MPHLATASFAGRVEVDLIEVLQSATYCGLEGTPGSGPTNEWEIQVTLARASQTWPDVPMYLVQPQLRPGGNGNMVLPPVSCAALLTREYFRGTALLELLVIVYFQDHGQGPIAHAVRDQLADADWARLAEQRENVL